MGNCVNEKKAEATVITTEDIDVEVEVEVVVHGDVTKEVEDK